MNHQAFTLSPIPYPGKGEGNVVSACSASIGREAA